MDITATFPLTISLLLPGSPSMTVTMMARKMAQMMAALMVTMVVTMAVLVSVVSLLARLAILCHLSIK